MIIKSHKDLAVHIAGKRVLHLNSFGKDSIACLEWLVNYAPSLDIVSLNMPMLVKHPSDDAYLAYLKARYPRVNFVEAPNPFDLTRLSFGVFQSPLEVMQEYNLWEYSEFHFSALVEDLRKEYECDFICIGQSKYESVARASNFYKKGILQGTKIFPLGLMTKEQVIGALVHSKVKLHPVYKLAQSTLDRPSYYKMRSTFIANPEYKRKMYENYPLLQLDEYRYEVLLKTHKKGEMR